MLGFLTWAAAGRDLPFPVSNQFAGTLSLATPLVFGALCGVLCERAGVVNVSIEGQFLAAAFAAAVVGSVTQSVPAAIAAAMVAGLGMAALLALFSINYLVNQVVLGVVLNLLAVGVTGSPKPPPERISLTFGALNRARRVWFLVSGEGKAAAVASALGTAPGEGAPDVHALPALGVTGREQTVWYLDAPAASAL